MKRHPPNFQHQHKIWTQPLILTVIFHSQQRLQHLESNEPAIHWNKPSLSSLLTLISLPLGAITSISFVMSVLLLPLCSVTQNSISMGGSFQGLGIESMTSQKNPTPSPIMSLQQQQYQLQIHKFFDPPCSIQYTCHWWTTIHKRFNHHISKQFYKTWSLSNAFPMFFWCFCE